MRLSRRVFLRSGLGGAGGWLVAGAAHASPEVANPDVRQRFVIVNADDLGISDEIDHGIFEAHDRRIVTSASLLVDGPHAADAVRLARQRPGLGLGIHVAFDDRGRWLINVQDPRVVQREVTRQLEAFERMTGVPPTHIDSHHHAHRFFNVARHFIEAGQRLPARAAPVPRPRRFGGLLPSRPSREPCRRPVQPGAGGGVALPLRRAGEGRDRGGKHPPDQLPRIRADRG